MDRLTSILPEQGSRTATIAARSTNAKPLYFTLPPVQFLRMCAVRRMSDNNEMAEHDEHPAATHAAISHPRHTGRFWFDFAAAGAAIFISVVSLVVAISGEHTQRELLAANAWPFPQIEVYRSPGSGFDEIVIRNQGVGPAKLFTFEVSFEGTSLRGSGDLLRRCCGLTADPSALHRQLANAVSDGDVAANVLRPDHQITMLRLTKTNADASIFQRFDSSLSRFHFEACYCSILDRCWRSNLQDLSPKQVRSCQASEHPFIGTDD